MHAWIVSDDGQQRIAVTTEEGFTVVGDVFGPGGQDISSALLAISGLSGPTASVATSAASIDAPISEQPQPPSPVTGTVAQPVQASPAATPFAAAASPALVPASPQAPAGASPPPITLSKAQTLDELFQQATDFSVWFSAGNPKPDAPAIYFVADPTCPHCAVAVDTLAQKVQAGDIDLRVILAPIRSQQAVYEAASILQSQTPAVDFMSHELSKTSSTVSTLKVLAPSEINPEVVRGLQRNVEWIRANGVQGVPFWIFNTAEGGMVEFGEVRDSMLASAIPARGSGQNELQGSLQ